jgi:hypothetical protein
VDGKGRGQAAVETGCRGGQGSPRAVAPSGWMDGWISEILNALNNKLLISGFFGDLGMAFDCANHKIILFKLVFYGITGKKYKLYKTYLTNRYKEHYNEIDKFTTALAKVEHGVPQVLVLESSLFLIYINGLPTFVRDKSLSFLFANDTIILLTSSDPTDFNNNINIVFKVLSFGFKQNLFSLNFYQNQIYSFHN